MAFSTSIVQDLAYPRQVPDNPLHALFLQAWTTEGFADQVAAAPHAMLAARGLALAERVTVTAFGWRSEVDHLCWTCQLAVPGFYAVLGPAAPREPKSPLDALFAGDERFLARAIASPHDVLVELGLALTANVRVRIGAGAAASLELQLCEGYHACLCATPELEAIVFANWKDH